MNPDRLRLPTSIPAESVPQGFVDVFFDTTTNQVVQKTPDGATRGLKNPIVDPPVNADDPGEPGSIAFDETYVYFCVAEDTWRRAATATWDPA